MNRHRATWSAMHDMGTEESQQSIDYKQLRADLQKMVNRFGFDEVATQIRRIYEEGQQ